MSVHQTRDHFLEKYGHIVDNPQVTVERGINTTWAALRSSSLVRLYACLAVLYASSLPAVRSDALLGCRQLVTVWPEHACHLLHCHDEHKWVAGTAFLLTCPAAAAAAAVMSSMQVGKDLTSVYWDPGNGSMFLDLVQQLTCPAAAAAICNQCRLART
jgi:hypothetical protein